MHRSSNLIALGGGGFSMEESPALDDYILAATNAKTPRVCFLPTASGDADAYITRFYAAFSRRECKPTHCALFRRSGDLGDLLLAQDVIYVGGGNTVNMLAIWRTHGVDAILADAWRKGIVLAGLSAGSICWFEGGVTDSFGALAPLADGLGLVPGTHCPHYDGEPERRPTYKRLVADGALAPGIAAEDGVGLHYQGTELVRVVTSREGARAYRVDADGETAIDAELL